ncbi:hypothetical protein KI688_004205 [Linnemannia hyalina]|uniref:Uncharacterized protein n=1 Tax=Linnemannia hyalina TaxID=64524 RepID=A0A9P8BPM7_9FUNG|nr:hypothetical protein KI688_004205 [Linnemannia hyalina]
MDVYTDASDKGWGIVIGNRTWSELWSVEKTRLHINWKEIQTAFLALTRPLVQSETVNIVIENTSTLSRLAIQDITATNEVESRSTILSTPQLDLGSSPRRSLRIAARHSAPTPFLLAPSSNVDGNGRPSPQLEEIRQPIPVPAVESDPTGTAATQIEEVGCHSDRSVLAISSMVPVGTGDVRLSSGPDPKDHHASSPRKRKSYPTQEPSLVVSVHSLQSPLKEIANIKAFLTTQQSSTIIDLPRAKQLIITDDAASLIPSISVEHFFFPPDNPDDGTISPNDLLFDKNPLQQYTAPALVKIIERQAYSTRPLDDLAVDFLAKVSDPAARQTVTDFIQIMRSNLANNAREVQELRNNNYLRAKGLQPVPEKKKGVSVSQEVIKAKSGRGICQSSPRQEVSQRTL